MILSQKTLLRLLDLRPTEASNYAKCLLGAALPKKDPIVLPEYHKLRHECLGALQSPPVRQVQSCRPQQRWGALLLCVLLLCVQCPINAPINMLCNISGARRMYKLDLSKYIQDLIQVIHKIPSGGGAALFGPAPPLGVLCISCIIPWIYLDMSNLDIRRPDGRGH